MPKIEMFCVNCVRKVAPNTKKGGKLKYVTRILKKQPLTERTYLKHFCRTSLKGGVDISQREDLFLHLLSAIRLHTWTVSRAGDSLLVSIMLLTFPKAYSDTIFYHQKQKQNSTKLDIRNSSQSKLT